MAEADQLEREGPIAAPDTLRLHGVRKSYGVGTAVETEVLHGIDLVLRPGEFAALIGPSGGGKSTLLNLIGLLDHPTSGSLHLLGEDTGALADGPLTRLRGRAIGFVFQYHHLLPAFTALENVMMPLLAAMNPALVLADEPTGNLDTKTADGVFDTLRKVNRDSGTTFLIVTHDPRLAQRCDRIIELVDGSIVSDKPHQPLRPVQAVMTAGPSA